MLLAYVVEIVLQTMMAMEFVMMLKWVDVWMLRHVTTMHHLLRTMALVITVLVYVHLLLTHSLLKQVLLLLHLERLIVSMLT